MNRKFLFIRHAAVAVNPAVPAREWSLSSDGRSRAGLLASQLIPHNPTRIITSDEPKAQETGQIIARELEIPWQTARNLQEHDRQRAPFFTSQEAFETAVARFFHNPGELVLGNETANQTFTRFDTAVHHLLTAYPDDTLAIVTHGTVLTLFLAHYNNFDPIPFWQQIKQPDYFVVSQPSMRLFAEQ
ncbi:MAG: histidine phosphatase family protein [Anaerolineae bacterium]